MLLVSTTLERIFILTQNGQKIRLSDPNPNWHTNAVINHYANIYPILTTAKISAPTIIDDTVEYHFVTTMGTKG
jgi:PRTRC genetic system protein C